MPDLPRESTRPLRRRLGRVATGCCLVLPALAMTCIQPLHVRLAEDSAPGRPSFTFIQGETPLGGLRDFAVYPCRPTQVQRPIWQLKQAEGPAADETPPAVLRITYGEVPPGYEATGTAVPLEPRKCYEAAATGSSGRWGSAGARDFYVERDGRVRQVRGETAFELAMKHEQAWHRVAVGCLRGYRHARSVDDSAAVDAREYPVADTAVSCGWMREKYPTDIAEARSSERGTLYFLGGVAALAALVTLNAAIDRTLSH